MIYRREIDGLRAFAVLPVIFFHAGMRGFSGGYVGVDVFFVISGYLITSILHEEMLTEQFSIIRFYERRARRILPALFLVMMCCLPAAWWWLLASDMLDFSRSLVAVSFFASNLLFWRQSGYFEAASELKPLLHTWSLAVEEQYYVFFPLGMWALSRLRQHWLVGAVAVSAIASLMAAQWASHLHPALAFFLLPTRAWELLSGALLALLVKLRSLESPLPNQSIRRWGAWIGACLILFSIVCYDKETPFPGAYALLPCLGTLLVIGCAHADTSLGRILSHSVPVGLGLLSYSAYLWHQPLFAFARLALQATPQTATMIVLTLASFLLATVSFYLVEKPFRDKKTVSRRKIFGFALVGTLCFSAVGVVGVTSHGFVDRFAPEDRALAMLGFSTGEYVERRFLQLQLASFDASGRRKILLVGDSYGEDLVNAIYEIGLQKSFQLSTRHINRECGNLYLPAADIDEYVDKKWRSACNNEGRFDDPKLKRLMTEADEIWLASDWTPWQANLVPSSVAALHAKYGIKIRVFGRKYFGEFAIRDIIKMSPSERIALTKKIDPEVSSVNSAISSKLKPNEFVDVQRLLCGQDSSSCHPFDSSGRLLSFDGGHLTVDGARLYGSRLIEQTAIGR